MTAAAVGYDEAVKRWAASRVGCEWTEIGEVIFGHHMESCGLSCDCDSELPDIRIFKVGNDGREHWDADYELNAENLTFASIVREIAAFAEANASVDEGHRNTLRAEAAASRAAAHRAYEERDRMRAELQKVIRIARDAHRAMGASFERLGEGVE